MSLFLLVRCRMNKTGNIEVVKIKGKVASIRPVDRSLTKSGCAADAKVTGDALEARVKKVDIADNLETDNPFKVLSASQGVELKRQIDELAKLING